MYTIQGYRSYFPAQYDIWDILEMIWPPLFLKGWDGLDGAILGPVMRFLRSPLSRLF